MGNIMKNFKTNVSKIKKNYMKFLAMVLSLTMCLMMMPVRSALATTHTTGLFAGKYGKAQVFDVFRDPTYPKKDESFNISNFGNAYDATYHLWDNQNVY